LGAETALKPSLWAKLEIAARQVTPLGLTLIATLTTVVPLNAPGLQAVAPVWPLMMVFHWALYRPDLMPLAAVFLIGLLFDALSGAPLGLNALVFSALATLVEKQRRFFYRKPFGIVWMGFAIVSAAAFLAAWAVASAWNGRVLDAEALTYQYLMTFGFYAPVSRGLSDWQKLVLRRA
jgi:rod shape-determining protein MreD